MAVLTRSRARKTSQPVFIDEQWNDAYIQTKDEQIEAMQAQKILKPWYKQRDDGYEVDDDEDDDSDETGSESGWDEEELDDDDDIEEEGIFVSGGGFFRNLFWTLMSVFTLPIIFYGLLLHPNG
jgi:hypothetical protein